MSIRFSSRFCRGLVCALTVVALLSFGVGVAFAGGQVEEEELAVEEMPPDGEAPMLRALVEAGELPPVEERLPEEPKVLDDFDIGMYGGTWRGAHVGALVWANEFSGIAGKPNLLSFSMEDASVRPNIAAGWEYEGDGEALILHLREGLKWSDGHPYTADQLVWWYEDVLQNESIYPSPPGYWLIRGELFDLEKIDDYTVRFSFGDNVAPAFHQILALRGEEPNRAPKHYFQDLHIEYADPDELQARLDEEGFEQWWELFMEEYEPTHWFRPDRRPDVPSMFAYVVVRQEPDVTYLERNPYYWKVDAEGNQLPYIDRARVENVADAEVLEAMAVAGEIDYHRGFAPGMSLYMQSVEDVGNQVAMWTDPQGSRITAAFNRHHPDEGLRELFNEPRFAQALSIAIDREEINDLVWLGLGDERQFTVLPPSPYLREEYETAYTEYDPDEALRILVEEVGLEQRADGTLLRPDGEVLRINLEVMAGQADWVQATELITDFWRDLGMDARMQARSEELHVEMFAANEIDVRMWSHRVPPPSLYYNIDNFIPHLGHAGNPEWGPWFATGGRSGTEPPEIAKQVAEWREEWLFHPDREVREEAIDNILAAQAEYLWYIGAVGNPPQPMVLDGDLANVVEDIWYAWDFAFIGMGRPEAWYFDNADRRADGGHW